MTKLIIIVFPPRHIGSLMDHVMKETLIGLCFAQKKQSIDEELTVYLREVEGFHIHATVSESKPYCEEKTNSRRQNTDC